MTVEVPEEFEELAPYVHEWGLKTEKERHHKRIASSLEAVRGFNKAVGARIHDMVAYLDKFPGADPDTLPPSARNLYNLALAFMETSHPVDLHWQRPDIDDAFPVNRIEYLSPIDLR